jgi:hypothetical protein
MKTMVSHRIDRKVFLHDEEGSGEMVTSGVTKCACALGGVVSRFTISDG